MSSTDELFQRFEQLRADRWNNIDLLVDSDEFDNMLADVANIATLLWVKRQVAKNIGFRAYGDAE